MAAVLLVFQYGQPRIFFAMARDGLLPKWAARVDAKTRIPYMTTLVTGVVVACWSLIGDAAETYDLTNIGTLFAFVLVCIGVIVLRVHGSRTRPRPFRVPVVVDHRAARHRRRVHLRHDGPAARSRGSGSAVARSSGSCCTSSYGYRHSRLRAKLRVVNECRAFRSPASGCST